MGVEAATVQRILRHSSICVTTGTYVDVIEQVQRTAVADMDSLLSPARWWRPLIFRKTVATLIDDAGLSARVGADQLGHTKVSMTQDNYMARNRVHTEVAELLDRAINDE
jgi:site-specific recombinase XerD